MTHRKTTRHRGMQRKMTRLGFVGPNPPADLHEVSASCEGTLPAYCGCIEAGGLCALASATARFLVPS